MQVEYEKDLSNKVKELEIRKSITEKSKALDPSNTVKAATQQKLKEKMWVIISYSFDFLGWLIFGLAVNTNRIIKYNVKIWKLDYKKLKVEDT